MKRIMFGLAALLVSAAIVQAAPTAGQTPQETINKVAVAMLTGDGTQLAACYKATPVAKGLIMAMGNLSKAAMPFTEKMKSAYGTSPKWVPNFPEIAMVILQGKLTVNGNQALIALKGGKTQAMVKENGVWLMVDKDFTTVTPAQAAQVVKQFRAMSVGMRTTIAKIGAPGVTAATIQQETTAVMKHEMSLAPTPVPRPTLPPLPAPKPMPKLPPLPRPAIPAASKFAPGSTPRATLDAIMATMVAGTGKEMVACYKTSPAGAIMLKSMCQLASRARAYSADHKKFFGVTPAYVPDIQTMLDEMAKTNYITSGNNATATDPKGKKHYMVRENGVWLAVDDDFSKWTAAQATANAKQVDAMTCTLNVLICRIGPYGGKTRTAAELAAEFQAGVKQRMK